MTIKAAITNLLSHFAPLTLVKQVFPSHKTEAYAQTNQASRPWMNVDEIELTAEDFA